MEPCSMEPTPLHMRMLVPVQQHLGVTICGTAAAPNTCPLVDVTVQVSVSPSEEEEEAALYNLACCYSKLGELDSGLAVLRGLLELPCFHDFDVLR